MGSLLIDYFLSSRQEHGALNERSVVIKTIVTTEMQTAIATSYGCQIFETLTGFKWIADKIASFEKMPAQKALKYECGGEESYGFLAGDFVRDKDGISAGALACEMVAYYKSQNKSLRQALEALHIRHGYYLDHLITRTFEGEQGARKIADTLSQLRANPPRELANIPVLSCKDFQTSQSWSIKDGERIPGDRLTLPQSNVLQFNLADGSRISARPSGTEPKIKFYLSLKETVVSGDLVAARNRAASKLQTIASAVESFLE
jgi:phosphoglucomutase